ncbi:MAG: GAF domain-containing protein [Planctomycetaceae bacterium]|nr:MAG: GAF domain-containing protein [Planctomycetaceae bacterium]
MTSPPLAPDEFIRDLLAHWLELAESSVNPVVEPHAGTVAVLDRIAARLAARSAGLVRQSGTRWTDPLATDRRHKTVVAPERIAIVADTLTTGLPQTRGPLVAGIVSTGEGLREIAAADRLGITADMPAQETAIATPLVLLVNASDSTPAIASELVAAAARVVGFVYRIETDFTEERAANRRRRFLLDAAVRWSAIESTDELLSEIAGAATRLLGAERASIFLWDRRRKKLIGRPALGVEGGTLEVDDDAGVVGAVLRDRTPHRWSAAEDAEREINRSVDRKLRFSTRSLVAVPLESPSGELLGVFEVLNKVDDDDPLAGFEPEDVSTLRDLARHAAAAIRGTQTRQRLTETRDRLLEDAAADYSLIGESPAIRVLRDSVARVAPTDLAVLVLGENGTGKEVLARSIHFQSQRRHEPFVAVNCAALVETLLESELFGHQRGAFTDAHQDRVGKFESAHGGTLFLDEIGDMSPGGQAKLLRVLEEKIVVRVGGSTPIPVDVRIIAATNQSLTELVAQKRFREDLFFRLNVVTFQMPPLRERGDDIVRLAEYFLGRFATQSGRSGMCLSEPARQALLAHRWRGNVRELRNVMERSSYLAQTETLTPADLGLSNELSGLGHVATTGVSQPAGQLATDPDSPESSADDALDRSLADATREFQIRLIRSTIQRQSGNLSSAAQALGLHRANLYRKMRQLGMSGP